MSKFQGLDFLRLDDLLSDEEKITRDTVRRFVDDKFMPLIDDHFEKATFPMEIIPKVGELGLFGMKLHGYGCAGTNNVQYGLACQELERGDSGLRSFMSVQSSLVMYPIHSFGSEEQKEYWLPRMAAGEKIGCFGLTEPDHGSDPAGMKTRAKKDGNDWVINGAKLWITNGDIADVAVVWARTDEGIKGFLVEKGAKGFLTFPIEKKMSLRASVTSGLIFEDVRIPEANRLPEANGLKCALMCLNEAPLRHFLGRHWGGHGLLRQGLTLFQRADSVWKAHRILPVDSKKNGKDVDRDF